MNIWCILLTYADTAITPFWYCSFTLSLLVVSSLFKELVINWSLLQSTNCLKATTACLGFIKSINEVDYSAAVLSASPLVVPNLITKEAKNK